MTVMFRSDFIAETRPEPGRRSRCYLTVRKSELVVTRPRFRVQLVLSLLFLITIPHVTASTPLLAAGSAAAPRSFPFNGSITAVEAVGMTVSDADRSIEFFSKILSFETVSDVEVAGSEYEHLQGLFGLRMRVVRMRLGDEFIELTEYLTPRGRPVPLDSRSNDHWFQHIAIITSDMDRAYQWLRKNKVQHASTGPQKLPETIKPAAGIRAFYFKDPDGHPLEVLSFPADKGAPKWHNNSDKLFMGIDHTAIVVSDTDASLRFYRDALGLTVAGESENSGTEQEHLNNVFGARLRITALRAGAGPGIEFLEYLTPRDGRTMPADAKASDLIHWQTKLVATDAGAIAGRMRAGRFPLVSPGLVQIPDSKLGFARSLLVRDPDGHAMQIVER
jgi:catechol 2,3-dioxygenase-like lactoylglutathione lyase family enzyme